MTPDGETRLSYLHELPGAKLYSNAVVDKDAKGLRIPIHGIIAGIEYDVQLDIMPAADGRSTTVTLTVNEPFTFKHSWTFGFPFPITSPAAAGLVKSGGGVQVLSTKNHSGDGYPVEWKSAIAGSAVLPKIDILCIIGCGGAQLLPTLEHCLFSLAAGIHGFLICLATQCRGAGGNHPVHLDQVHKELVAHEALRGIHAR